MSVSCDGEYPEVSNAEIRRARLPHKCCACQEEIRPGDWHHYTFYIFEGIANEDRRCLRCEAIYRVLLEKLRGDPECEAPAPYLDCGHTWQQRYGEEPPPEVARLAFMTADEIQAEGARLPGLAKHPDAEHLKPVFPKQPQESSAHA